jgi:hypothetical protein
VENGELLDAAKAAGVDVSIATDRQIQHQQKLTGLQGVLQHDSADVAGDGTISGARRIPIARAGPMLFPAGMRRIRGRARR